MVINIREENKYRRHREIMGPPSPQVRPLGRGSVGVRVCHVGHLPGLVPQDPVTFPFLLLLLSKPLASCRGPGVLLGEAAWHLCSHRNQKQVTSASLRVTVTATHDCSAGCVVQATQKVALSTDCSVNGASQGRATQTYRANHAAYLGLHPCSGAMQWLYSA